MAWYIYKGYQYIPGVGVTPQWKKIKNIYRKTTPSSYSGTSSTNFTDVSKEWRRSSGFYRKTSTGWRRVFTKTSTGVVFTTGPAIHLYGGASNPYGPNDGISVSSPRYLNEVLYGKDGIWTPRNEISITRSFQAALTPDGGNRFVIDNNDVFDLANNSQYWDLADETYLYYRINVQNYGDLVTANAGPIKLIKREASFNSQNLTGTTTVGSTLSGTYSLENRWYNKPELYNSYIRWWRSTSNDPSGTLVREEYLGDHVSTNNSTSLQGSDSYTIQAADAGYYIVFQVVPYNSYNRHYGYQTYMSYPSNIISAPITISGVNFTDSNGRSGKNARGNLVTSTTTYLNWTVGGVTPSTTFRVRYRVLNNQNGLYYNPNDPTTSLAAGSAWQTYTKNYNGTGDISSISINGSTATLYDVFTINSTFNGSTYGGGISRWSFQYEISVVNSSGTRYYWVYGDSISTSQANDYWDIDPTTNPSIAASSSSVVTGGSVTFTGTFNSYPTSLSSYPQSYKIVYGDGYDSGWISLSSGTANQSYSQSHTYSSVGTYSAYVQTTPSYTTNSVTITVANAITTPTGLYGYANGSAATQSITLNWNATSDANTYELFFNGNATPPTDYAAYADYKGITTNTYTTPVIFSASNTYYWYVRGKGSSGTFSTWSPAASVTTNAQALAAPTGVSATTTRSDGVNITWNAVSGASYYGIWWGGAPGFDYAPDFPNIYATSYLDTGISAGSSRDYYVRAYTAAGVKGNWSTVATGTRTVALAVPSTPTWSYASTSSSDYVLLIWNQVSGATSYEIWWGGPPGDSYTPDFYPGNTNYYYDYGIGQGSSRTYYVRARNASGASSWSSGITGTRTSAAVALPGTPSISGNNSLAVGGTFSWSATNATSYAFSVYGPSGLQYSTYGGYVGTTSFRPGYDATWQGAGTYTIYVYAHNSGGDSSTASLSTYMN
jgi:hypothetical protein